MRLTVLGASGFIGHHLVRRVDATDWEIRAPAHEADLSGGHLGHVVYAIGVTGEFRTRILDTVDAHVCRLGTLLSAGNFDSLTYLSSTRVYSHNPGTAHEDDLIAARPADVSDLYNLTKLLAESLLLASGRRVRVLRLSNVYGIDARSPNFLALLIREAIATRRVRLETSAASVRDYVSVDDVTDVILRTMTDGAHAIYNVASGINLAHGELAAALADLVDGEVVVEPDAPMVAQPAINIDRLVAEFGFQPRRLLDDLPALVSAFRREKAQTS